MSTTLHIFIYALGGFLFTGLALLVSKVIRPDQPNAEKLSAYESGEEPQGLAWVQVDLRFYVLTIIFLLFEVEIVFLFPWATIFADPALNAQTNNLWGWFTLVEVIIFILVLVLGLAYAWRNGHLDGLRPEPKIPDFKSPVPEEFYNRINEQYKGK